MERALDEDSENLAFCFSSATPSLCAWAILVPAVGLRFPFYVTRAFLFCALNTVGFALSAHPCCRCAALGTPSFPGPLLDSASLQTASPGLVYRRSSPASLLQAGTLSVSFLGPQGWELPPAVAEASAGKD